MSWALLDYAVNPDSRLLPDMFKNILGYFSNDLSIDLGTANTLIYSRGARHCARRAVGCGNSRGFRPGWPQCRGGRRGSQEHAGPHTRQYHGHSTSERRRDRRFHGHREDVAAFHQKGARFSLFPAQPAGPDLRAVRLNPGRTPRNSRICRRRRRAQGTPYR